MKNDINTAFSLRIIEARIHYLEKLSAQKEKAVRSAPKGSLKIVRRGKPCQYYFRDTSIDKKWHFIRRRNDSFAGKLAQRDYDALILRAADRELKILHPLAALYQKGSVEKIYSRLPVLRRDIVSPVRKTTAQRLAIWKSIRYEGKPFYENAKVYESADGEKFRSKSELIIANMLKRFDVPYRYEKPLELKNFGTVYPDFTLYDFRRDCEIYWEHLGMMDDSSYRDAVLSKLADYERNDIYPGDRLILTFETIKQPLNTALVEKQIRRILRRVNPEEAEKD